MQSPLQTHSLHFLHKGHQTMFNPLYAALISSCLSYQKDMSNARDKAKHNFTKTPFSLKGKKLARWSERFIFHCPMPTCINHVTSLVLLKNSSAAFYIILPRIAVRLTDIKLPWSFHLHCLARLSFFLSKAEF